MSDERIFWMKHRLRKQARRLWTSLAVWACLFACNSVLYAQQKTQLGFDDIPLTWRNFTKRSINTNSIAAALTYIHLQLEYKVQEDILTISIKLEQSKEKSWVSRQFLQRATDPESIALLEHEKIHYAINMIGMRQLYLQLNEAEFSQQEYKSEITGIFAEFNRQTQSLNSAYDRETRHGLLTDKQLEWNERIFQELNELYPPGTPLATEYIIRKQLK